MDQKIMFHGSPYSFARFNPSKSGIHFGTYDQAAHAACLKLARIPLKEFEKLDEVNGWRGKIYKCELKIEKIKRINDPRTPQAWSRQIKKACAEGFDSIVYDNEYEGANKSESICVFSPDQISSINLSQ